MEIGHRTEILKADVSSVSPSSERIQSSTETSFTFFNLPPNSGVSELLTDFLSDCLCYAGE